MLPEFPESLLVKELTKTTHVVLKFGTGALTPHVNEFSGEYFKKIAVQCRKLLKQGKKPIIVTSGAVGYGKILISKHFNQQMNYASLTEKQALASLGQGLLINMYRIHFEEEKLPIAQILVSNEDFNDRKHYNNLKNTLDMLLQWGCVPVINENDAVSNEQIRVGDNDTLSASVAGMYEKSLLLLLTTIDGFYYMEKKLNIIHTITPEILKSAGSPAEGGTGGMRTKLMAGEMVLRSGQIMNICPGNDPSIIENVLAGKTNGTWFFQPDSDTELSARKRWLLQRKFNDGQLTIDTGASEALLKKGASLLAVGVKAVTGLFEKGDIADVIDQNGRKIGRGILSVGSEQLNTGIREKVFPRGLEAIHRDNMVLF